MSVLYLLTTATKTQTAPILMDRSNALVTVDILEMELCAKVNKSRNFLYVCTIAHLISFTKKITSS
jgi:transcription initiation factor IIE alpha subunit